MNIIFFGSDDFAAAHLKALIDSGHDIVACVTQPDRPKGRGMKIVLSKIKEYAQDNDIPVLQPLKVNDKAFIKELGVFQADLFVVIAYGQYIPKAVRDMPAQGSINVHPSLLPKYRGAAPINWAVINGDKQTGISIIKVAQEMDAGDILAVKTMDISGQDTSLTLRAKMMDVGPDFLLQTINDIAQGQHRLTPQNAEQATMAPKLMKELGAIEWSKSSQEIYNLIRGSLPWPGAYTKYMHKSLKILEAQVAGWPSDSNPGTVLDVNEQGIVVSTGNGSLILTKVHLQDAKPMDAPAFVRGHDVQAGFKFK